MKKLVLDILKDIKLDKIYIELCLAHCNFDESANLNRKEIEPIIKSFDPDFKYIARDRVFLKEILHEGFIVRFFIGYRSGIVDFSYLLWKEGESDKYRKGRLATLTELIDPKFKEKVEYKTPIATSLDEFQEILIVIITLFKNFKKNFFKEVRGD